MIAEVLEKILEANLSPMKTFMVEMKPVRISTSTLCVFDVADFFQIPNSGSNSLRVLVKFGRHIIYITRKVILSVGGSGLGIHVF